MKTKVILSIIVLLAVSYIVNDIKSDKEPDVVSEQIIILPQDTLSEWQLFTLALIEVESENDSLAISIKDARGILQLTQVYIEDVNRLTGWNLSIQDAHDNQVALICFDTVQAHYNPEHSIEKAIRLHNPKAGPWYAKRIYNKMEAIKVREQMRSLIVTQ